jgi:uncharacterized membrane protein YkvA (DUF1232 family)
MAAPRTLGKRHPKNTPSTALNRSGSRAFSKVPPAPFEHIISPHPLFVFSFFEVLGYSSAMAEIVDFVNRGAASITPAAVEKMLRHLPQWKLEFTQINEPLFPHLVDQLEFLADAVEDTAEGVYKDLPYRAFSQAVFALIYAHKKVGIIPDTVLNLGRADDSSVVRAVLIQNETVFAIYAAAQNREWSKITSHP